MLSITDYLLTKLNEECVEIADVAVRMNREPSSHAILTSEMSNEINDVMAIVEALPHSAIAPPKVDALSPYDVANQFNCPLDADCELGFKSNLLHLTSLQALSTAKMATKCMVFGLNETYVGQSRHNTHRLSVEISKLQSLFDELGEAFDGVAYCYEAKRKKRAKMLSYMALSLEQEAVEHACVAAFQDIISKVDL